MEGSEGAPFPRASSTSIASSVDTGPFALPFEPSFALSFRGFSNATLMRSTASSSGRTRSNTSAMTEQSSPPEKSTAIRASGGGGTGGTVKTRARTAVSSSERSDWTRRAR